MASEKLTLFSYFRSSCAWRVRIALAYKGLPYETIPVQLLKYEHLKPEFLQLNPMGQVPALVIELKCGISTLNQSMAILEYLEEKYPEKNLLPKDLLARAKVREICEVMVSGIQPLQNIFVLDRHSTDEMERLKFAQHWIHKGLKALEKMLSQCAGKYCFGDNVTMADCCLVPQVANAHRFHVPITEFEIIGRIDAELGKLDAFKKAHALNQIDCPPEMKSKY